MKKIPFIKMNGCGNDFVIIDNRSKIVSEKNLIDFARKICKRKVSVGADGLLIIENSLKYNFKMRLFNSDGTEGEMCGNGARCIAKYAFLEGIANKKMIFETLAGKICAEVKYKYIGIELPNVKINEIIKDKQITVNGKNYVYSYLFLGVPHCVIFLKENLPEEYLFKLGRKIRFNKKHFPKGTNVNFVKVENNNTLFVKTYERGVEEITLSCGTGSLSSAIISSFDKNVNPPIKVKTKGGTLTIDFTRNKNIFKNILLLGDVKIIARGELLPQSYNY